MSQVSPSSPSLDLRIIIGSHNFCVDSTTERARKVVMIFAGRFASYTWENVYGEMVKVLDRVYASSADNKREFRFHINSLAAFEQLLTEHGLRDVERIVRPMYEPISIDIKLRKEWVGRERENQKPLIEYLTNTRQPSRFLGAQTGFGKTAVATMALARILQRTVILVQPRYMVKWQEDLLKMYDIDVDSIMHVSGSQHLKKLLSLAKEGMLDVPFIIISSKTFQNYIKAYTEKGAAMMEDGWDAIPPHFFEAVGAGQRLIDEVHQEFHLMFTVDLYTHIPGSISLSATLIHKDAFIRKMHATMFPPQERCPVPELIKYIDSFAVHAMFDRVDKLRTSERGGRGYYSHNALERSIVANKKVLANYLKFVEWMVSDGYGQMKRAKKSVIIFASTVEMCTVIRDHFRKVYPHLRVERYVGTMKDPYDNLLEADIKVSTLGSAGTAHDMPDLTNVVLTICVDSVQANVQSLGRLRQLGDGETVFHYVVYDDIPKSLDYHRAKKDMLRERARTVNDLFPGFIL